MKHFIVIIATLISLGGCSTVESLVSNLPETPDILPDLSLSDEKEKAKTVPLPAADLPRSRQISFVVAPENRWNYGEKEFEIIRSFIIDEIARKGYQPYIEPKNTTNKRLKRTPDLAVLVDYMVEPKMIQSHKVPVYGLTSPGFTTHVTHKGGEKGNYAKQNVQQPVYGVKEYKQFSHTVFMKHFKLKIVDYFSLKNPESEVFYEAQATATENTESIIPSAPAMIRSLVNDLPEQPKPAPIIFNKDAPSVTAAPTTPVKQEPKILKLKVLEE